MSMHNAAACTACIQNRYQDGHPIVLVSMVTTLCEKSLWSIVIFQGYDKIDKLVLARPRHHLSPVSLQVVMVYCKGEISNVGQISLHERERIENLNLVLRTASDPRQQKFQAEERVAQRLYLFTKVESYAMEVFYATASVQGETHHQHACMCSQLDFHSLR